MAPRRPGFAARNASANNRLILIEAPVFGGLGSSTLASKNVFADTTILSEKEASNAILYPAT
ncbi:MAG: hypothetical protein WAO95_12570, partial [Burkholderiales bacterium]